MRYIVFKPRSAELTESLKLLLKTGKLILVIYCTIDLGSTRVQADPCYQVETLGVDLTEINKVI